jgi:isoquinoline 1-oxidoreductase beta subunit
VSPGSLSRRGFIGGLVAAGGFVLAQPRVAGAALQSLTAAAPDELWQADLFLAVAPDGTVTIIAHRSEMGTGIRTTLPMVLADEMEADWSRVKIEQALGDDRYGSQNTDGSRSIRESFGPMRRIGATARWILEAAAAEQWGVPREECKAAQHQVLHAKTGRSLGYGELAAAAAKIAVPKPEQVTLKKRAEWRMIGKTAAPITDLPDIVTGKALFGADVRLEGMLTAVIARPPVVGGKVKNHSADAALAVPGVVRVLRMADGMTPPGFRPLGGVAVLAQDTWSAMKGRDQLTIEWDDGPHANYDSVAFRDELLTTVRADGRVVRERGDAKAGLAAARGAGQRLLEAEYYLPHLSHAPMEPPCAVARVSASGCEVWAPTQNPQAARNEVAAALGIPPDQVKIHVTLLGGGFGRKSKPDFVVEAALLAKEAGAPVRVQWTREDDLRHDYYHTVGAMRFQAALGADGMPAAWLQSSAFPPIGSTFNSAARAGSDGEVALGFSDMPFDLQNLRIENGEAPGKVRIGWFRSVCNVFHAFGVQTFADECAHAAGRDPLEYQLALMGPPRIWDPAAEGFKYGNYGESLTRHPYDVGRLRAVLERAAKEAGWGRKLPAGRGLGLAVHRSFCAYVAVVAEVEAAPNGSMTIHRVDVAADCGVAVHPDRVRSQMEGAVVFGISLTRFGSITAKAGRIEQSNFHDYPIARMSDCPRDIRIHLLESDAAPAGVGEAGLPPVAPALGNALFAATGRRARELPFGR